MADKWRKENPDKGKDNVSLIGNTIIPDLVLTPSLLFTTPPLSLKLSKSFSL